MAPGQNGHKLIAHQFAHLKAFVGHHHKAQLHPFLKQPLVHHLVAFFLDAHLNLRVALLEGSQPGGQQMHGGRGAKRANAQRARLELAGVQQLLPHGGSQGRHFAGSQQQALAGICQLNA
jgi:hypothetical protein